MDNIRKNRIAPAILSLLLLISCAGCGRAAETQAEAPAAAAEKRSSREIIEEMVTGYGSYGGDADGRVAVLLRELEDVDADTAARWEAIMSLWKSSGTDLALNYDVLPDGLADTDGLGIVALGFQLAPDGSMREELVERLKVVLKSAEKYPNALIFCTGGPTASQNGSVTEAGRMAEWLIAQGVAPERVVAEDRSLTTAQNALYTFEILEAQYPQVRELAIVSSDYHIATGALLFGAASILRAEKAGGETVRVVSNAAWKAPGGSLSAMFQAGALLELSGDTDTAFDIYYGNYDIHELPPLN